MHIAKHIFRFIDFVILPLVVLFVYAWRIEPRWVSWSQVDMPTKNLPENWINKKIVQISDIHIGDVVQEDYIIKQFKNINYSKPDVVVYTGDFISAVHINQAPYDQLQSILAHHARGSMATIAILGNHDYSILARNGKIADSVVQILKSHDIIVLRNESVNIHGLNFIGIDDYWGTNFNLKKALSHYHENEANLILCHNPDVVDLEAFKAYSGWILSGHTHGGQVRIPFGKTLLIPVENKNYDSGLIKLDENRTLYINRGLGLSIRFRFNVRPEITQFTLKKKLN